MQLTTKTFAALRNVSIIIVVSLAACPAALAQITVTSATFPVAGDVLKTAVASNPAIGIAAYGPPGFGLFWDLSGLQPGVLKNTSFQPASQGTVGAQVPGAELFAVTSPGSEEYYNVTANKFETQYSYGKFYDVVPNYLAQYSPPMTERNAPMNFFDIYASSTGMLAGSVCIPVADDGLECSFSPSEFPPALVAALPAQPISLRYRLTINRIETVDAYGTMSIPGGTYNVLRLKRTQYRETRLDGKYPPLGWLDITANAIPAGFQGLGVDTIVTYFFYNDVVKEPIAVVTFNNELNAATQVIYKYNAPVVSCTAPTGLTTTNITSTSALVKWSPVAGAKTYKILYKTSAGTVWTTINRNSSFLSYKLTGLTPSTAYVWKMRTVCTVGGQSSLTTIKRFTTKATGVAAIADASEANVSFTPGFSIYPNPAKHFFVVDMRSDDAVTGKAEIQVISALGKMVYKENTAVYKGALKKQINLPVDIAAGYYLVRVVMGEKVYSSKLMIQE